jgi:hypothetical protein
MWSTTFVFGDFKLQFKIFGFENRAGALDPSSRAEPTPSASRACAAVRCGHHPGVHAASCRTIRRLHLTLCAPLAHLFLLPKPSTRAGRPWCRYHAQPPYATRRPSSCGTSRSRALQFMLLVASESLHWSSLA